MAETPETTPAKDWSVPNQDKLEQVIDARLGGNSESEVSETDSEAVPDDEGKDQAEEPKS